MLERGAEVQGVVQTVAGIPVSGVQVIPVSGRVWINERAAKTNDKGEFRISCLGEGFRFDILKSGYNDYRNVTLRTGGFINTVELESVGAVAGTVVDENEDPVRNFNVRVRTPRQRDHGEDYGGYYAGFGWYGVSYTRNDGNFVLSELTVGNWARLIVRSRGFGFAIVDRNEAVPLDELSPDRAKEIKLVPFKPLSVRVLAASSKKPLANADVIFVEDEPEYPYGFNWGYDDLKVKRRSTDDTGKAVFSEPACEDGTLAVLVPGYARKHIAWTDKTPEVILELDVASKVTGTVHFRNRLVTVGGVALSNENDRYYANLADSNGTFTFDQISAGEYELEIIDVNGATSHTQQITVKVGEKKNVEVEIPESTKFDFSG